MAFDTRQNLTNEKFEQISGETLNLSGNTNFYGQFKLIDGTEGDGFLLTSDSQGQGIWKSASNILIPSSENITREEFQTSHGFLLGEFIGYSGGTYNKAIANGSYDGEFIGVITEVIDTNNFKVTQAGYVSGLTGLSANTTYWLSPTVEGEITGTEPTSEGQIAKPILLADSSESGWVFPYPGFVITTGDSLNFEVISVACSDEISDLASTSGITTFRMPFAMALNEVRASVTSAPSGTSIVVDINESGSSILSTLISIDSNEKTSTTASSQPVISDSTLSDDSEITIDLDQVGSSTPGSGLKVYLIGERTS